MGRSEARIRRGIWRGLRGVSPHAKLLYAVLLTEPTMNHAGVCARRLDLWAENAELSDAETEKAFVELIDGRYVYADPETREVLVRTVIRRDGVAEQPYLLKGALKEALQTESPALRWVLAEELRKLPPQPPDGVSKAGHKIVYPDPHGAADELDPRSPDPDGEGSKTLSRGSREVLDTLSTPSREHPSQNPFESHSKGNGVGEGVGEGVRVPVDENSSFDQSAARAHARGGPRPGTVPVVELARTAVRPNAYVLVHREWRSTHETPYRPTVYRQIAKIADGLMRDGAEPDLVLDALRDWDTRGRAPAFLTHCYDDAVHRTRGSQSPTDAYAEAFLRGESHSATDASALRLLGNAAGLRAIPGGKTA